ncbi:rod shape-determining protein MreC [Patescibacteria group bacterium]|nr:rod shape-determining protein MreC [Patescibacteria group bacterium]
MARTSNPFSSRSVYSSGRKPGGWFSFRFFTFAAICLVLLGAGIFWHNKLEGALWSFVGPLQRARVGFDASDNQRLRAQLASTTALVADRNALYEENLQLKNRLGRNASKAVILAGVLQRPPATPYDTLMIDAGAEEGVHQNDFVSAGGTMRIGTVAEVYAHTSRVVLFSAPGQTYDVLLRLASTTQVVPVSMQGQGSGSFVGQVPAGTPVKVGDSLVFPGIASAFAGTVSSVLFDPKQSFITLYARLPVDLLSLQYVEIEKDSYVQR